mmetsp:Transcript_20931/g.18269  ORF Transcript_20931/g.18269 Transcript_20931/m.18269 type:complete len:541 (+) Transcript_20931:42-1664(+)|eukprot:CAMPEP_0114583290 /NCGR_PEP_ID=MMETSP0125-20121206/7061_1 /TAXON_ID=485358 ORGANISM="Aristerostoma sp., Strain ATCC 50986" /NCGR_SAMPLE_ID=MMETSP0125 /ASSEMBLY_ACC=CAM_ASM_000245 /LENGTH=540 /DNA_ID=CAMNT_0001776675 /DNA_START=17 /DNA_END=1639 /DNA_ORIENTATION=+
MSLAFDEFGRPYLIIKEQAKKLRLKGAEAFKSNIAAARTVANTIKSSMGPKGMDKMLQSPDGDIIVTNDGATIMEKMEVTHPMAKLLVELSQSQDNEIGDGTTGIVVLAGALLEQASSLIDKGLHPLQIADGFEKACEIAIKRLEEISETVDVNLNNHENLKLAAMTSLGSKVVNKCQRKLAEISVEAVLSVADLERKDVNFDMIKMEGKAGESVDKTRLIEGILLDKNWSHGQMVKDVKEPKICIITAAFEPPKPQTKHNLELSSAKDYKTLYQIEQNYFKDMVKKVKDSGANVVLCQWGFDDEANHLLLQNGINAVRWVGGVDIELLSLTTGGAIIPRFSEITPEKLGKASSCQELSFGTNSEKMILIEKGSKSKAVTILVRGGNTMIVDEAKRSIHDSLCVVRNLIKDNRIVYGGGSPELAASLAVQNSADKISGVEQYAVRAFADALENVPYALADNSGLWPIETVAEAKANQVKTGNPRIGIDCKLVGDSDMKTQGVYESFISKKQQFQLATQVVKMILKIDDVISPDELAQYGG